MFEVPMGPRTLAAALRDVRSDAEMTRIEAVCELARFECSLEVESALLSATCDDSVRVRESALQSLVALGSGKAPDVARHALLSPHAPLRFQALIALAETRDDDAFVRCMAALSDSDAEVRYIALRLLDDESLALAPAAHARSSAAVLRSEWLRLLGDAAGRVRLAAAIPLARSEGEGVWSDVLRDLVLTARVCGEVVPEEDAAEAMRLLVNCGNDADIARVRRCAFGLQTMLSGRSVRRAARAALQGMQLPPTSK